MSTTNYREFLVSVWILILVSYNCNNSVGQSVVKQGPPVPANFCIDTNEMELYMMINQYRQQHSLPPIPLSKSLSQVAALHVKDLFFHHPDQGVCNFHSWSDKGAWTAFCYPKDESKKNSVWDKPRELTKYPSKAYEIVYWENIPLVKDSIIMVWETEDYFNSFLLNTGKWKGKQWKAIGIAVYKNYASAWFGEVEDPEGEAYVCGRKPEMQLKDTIKPVLKPVKSTPEKSKKPKRGKISATVADSLTIKHSDTLTVRPKGPKTNNHAKAEVPKDSVPCIYYIIVKTNLGADAATKLVKTLSGDYPEACVLKSEGKIRISAFQSPDREAVIAKLKIIKKTFKDAWLLKR